MRRRCLDMLIILSALLTALPALSWGGQFKITDVYDARTVRAEGYDTGCLP